MIEGICFILSLLSGHEMARVVILLLGTVEAVH